MLDTIKGHIREYRHRKIIKEIKLSKRSVVLDCSSGSGGFLNLLHSIYPSAKLFGIDVGQDAINVATKQYLFAQFSEQSIEKVDFNDSTFDSIISLMAFHHYKNPKAFFSEIERVLKPGGVLLLADIQPKYKATQKIQNRMGCMEPYHFEKYYSLDEIETLLSQTRLTIKSDIPVTTFPQRVRLLRIAKHS